MRKCQTVPVRRDDGDVEAVGSFLRVVGRSHLEERISVVEHTIDVEKNERALIGFGHLASVSCVPSTS